MLGTYEGVDSLTVQALQTDRDRILAHERISVGVSADAEAMSRRMADRLLNDYAEVLASGASDCAMIVPVGPVGQYDIIAAHCVANDLSLDRLTLIVMDEYLTMDNHWVPESNPLSFRGHIKTHLLERLPANMRPRVLVPDPANLTEIPEFLAKRGGLDFTYAGVGITGHLAFNDPIPDRDDPDWFADLPTRIVSLLPDTRLINSVTAARGNLQFIPSLAVTVGMREILSARTLRIWMNRHWQCAAVRRMLFGPVTGAFPASLIQRHGSVSLEVTEEVLKQPEPGLA